MTTALLYAGVVLTWGTTWIAMKFQLGFVDPAASLAYRYGAAAVLVFLWGWLSGARLRLPLAAHPWVMLQGALILSLNFYFAYRAAEVLTTGVIAVAFSCSSVLTLLISAAINRQRPEAKSALGALIGVGGLACVFWRELAVGGGDAATVEAFVFVALSLTFFSCGGLISARNHRAGLDPVGVLGWGMAYGAALMAAVVIVSGSAFTFDTSSAYLISLGFLIVPGSVLVFMMYFSVIARIGAERAAYVTVLFPIVALMVSTVVEGYVWTPLAVAGVPLVLFGNALILWRPGLLTIAR